MSEIELQIKRSNESKYSVKLLDTCTVAELKDAIAKVSDVPADLQRLIYSGRVLKDEETLVSYKAR
jgi:ubiquilin